MREQVTVQFVKIHADAQAPTQGSSLAAGWDLRAIDETVIGSGTSVKGQNRA